MKYDEFRNFIIYNNSIRGGDAEIIFNFVDAQQQEIGDLWQFIYSHIAPINSELDDLFRKYGHGTSTKENNQ